MYVINVISESGTTEYAMRDYDTGAARDDNANKLSYSKGLSSQVLQRYLEYLGKHRVQADGKLRDWDNCGD